jgi:hypothetical protein
LLSFGAQSFAFHFAIAWWAFSNLCTVYSIFQFFSGCGEPQIIKTVDTESADTRTRLYLLLVTELEIDLFLV